MEGVTAAIVAFIFACVLFPRLVANRPQFYAAFALAMAIVLLDGVGQIFGPREPFRVFAYTMNAVLQVGAVVLLFLSAGGLTWRGLTKEMRGAFEVIRRGETEKEVIIPLEGQKRRAPPDRAGDPEDRIELEP